MNLCSAQQRCKRTDDRLLLVFAQFGEDGQGQDFAGVARPLRRALQCYFEDPLSEAMIAGQITARPAFLEVYLEIDQLYYRPLTPDDIVAEEKPAGVLLFSA
jgi:hypothetical protein